MQYSKSRDLKPSRPRPAKMSVETPSLLKRLHHNKTWEPLTKKQQNMMSNCDVHRQETQVARHLVAVERSLKGWHTQGLNEVRWRPGQEASLAHTLETGLSETNVLYWRKYLRHFWDFSTPPQWFGARGIALPLLCLCTHLRQSDFHFDYDQVFDFNCYLPQVHKKIFSIMETLTFKMPENISANPSRDQRWGH